MYPYDANDQQQQVQFSANIYKQLARGKPKAHIPQKKRLFSSQENDPLTYTHYHTHIHTLSVYYLGLAYFVIIFKHTTHSFIHTHTHSHQRRSFKHLAYAKLTHIDQPSRDCRDLCTTTPYVDICAANMWCANPYHMHIWYSTKQNLALVRAHIFKSVRISYVAHWT